MPMTSLQPIILATLDGDSLRDSVAASEYLGITISAINQHLYGARIFRIPFPRPVQNAPDLLADDESTRAVYAELLRRAGGHGESIKLWRESELAEYYAKRHPAKELPLGAG